VRVFPARLVTALRTAARCKIAFGENAKISARSIKRGPIAPYVLGLRQFIGPDVAPPVSLASALVPTDLNRQ
jgi:hypothetical protein